MGSWFIRRFWTVAMPPISRVSQNSFASNSPGKPMKREIFVFLTIGLGFVTCAGLPAFLGGCGRGMTQAPTQESEETLSAAGAQELRTIVQSGRLDDLRWPSFSKHSASVKEFYKETGFKLGWIQSGKPTAQALELIRILEEAETKGLDSKDYDGGRWPDRI